VCSSSTPADPAAPSKPGIRPLVVLSGYADPGLAPHFLSNTFGEIFDANDIVGTAFPTAMTLDACRERVIELVNKAYPSEDPNLTVEVDVIARYLERLLQGDTAADPQAGGISEAFLAEHGFVKGPGR